MLALIVPTINSNDSDALLQTWLKADGDEVQAGETVAVLETTKASFDLIADSAGLLHIAVQPGQRYAYGTSLGWIFANGAEREQFFLSRETAEARTPIDGLAVTRAAQELIDRHQISPTLLASLKKKVIKVSDLYAFIASAGADAASKPAVARSNAAPIGQPLPAQQQSIARVVSKSHSTIPSSFILKKITVDAALAALGEFSRSQKALAGLPDLLTWIVARLPEQFPHFYGALHDDLTFAHSSAGNINVTFDVGHGLFMPVIRDGAKLSLKDIAKQMMQFRMRATRNNFRTEDLSAGDISISLNMDADVLCVIPVILPPQTCILSISAVHREVDLDAAGQPTIRRYIQLGAAFDHRAINGFAANAFLNAIKTRLEQPEIADW